MFTASTGALATAQLQLYASMHARTAFLVVKSSVDAFLAEKKKPKLPKNGKRRQMAPNKQDFFWKLRANLLMVGNFYCFTMCVKLHPDDAKWGKSKEVCKK